MRWLLTCVVLAGCSGGGSYLPRRDGGVDMVTVGDGAAADFAGGGVDSSAPDLAPGADLARPPDLTPAACGAPSDCPFDAPICCALIKIGPGTPPNCPVQSVQGTCGAACPTALPFQCPADAIAALCTKAADCTDANYPYCCKFTNGGTPITGCVDSIYKLIAIQCF